MGGGHFSKDTYSSSRAHRASTGKSDFEYNQTATKVHANLDPKRIKNKPFAKLESRDNSDHPESNAVLLCIDVTGSNITRAIDAQQKLPNLMDLLHRYLSDPQLAIAANDDYHIVGDKALQISDFESDNRIDEHIRNLMLTGKGGGNNGESYDLLMWTAANRTVLDCFEKRNRKGYFFMYADEPIFKTTSPEHLLGTLGETIPSSIPIEATVHQLKQLYHTFVLWPDGGYPDAKAQYIQLFGKDCVVVLQDPALICESIGAIIGMVEGRLNTEADVTNDLVAVGTSHQEAAAISKIVLASGHRRIHPAASSAV